MRRGILLVLMTAVACAAVGHAQTSAGLQQFRDIYRELVETNTTASVGDTTKAAEAMAGRLRAAGFPPADVQVLGAHPRRGNLVARLRGSGASRPLLLLAHLDVVEARREDWSVDPFKLTEQDGYFYGRGVIDDKAMAAIFVDTMVRLKGEGVVPGRDLILALTADEETGASGYNGVRWLLGNHRELIDAELALNEGGGGELRNGRRLVNRVQTSEKVPMNFRLEVLDPGGHSSRPVKDNAIYHLAQGLARFGNFDFPLRINDTVRVFFERSATLQTGPLADDMRAVARVPPDPGAAARLSRDSLYNALMRTTCVATRVEGGHATNALPQMARATLNCRLLPDDNPEDVRRTIVTVLADDRISVTPGGTPVASPSSALRADVMGHVERITTGLWPGVLVIPTMSTGATDGRYLRNAGIPTYGVSGLFVEATDNRTHGRDERIGIDDLYAGREFLDRLVRALASS